MSKRLIIVFSFWLLFLGGLVVLLILPQRATLTAEFLRYDTNNDPIVRIVNSSRQEVMCLWRPNPQGLPSSVLIKGRTTKEMSLQLSWRVTPPYELTVGVFKRPTKVGGLIADLMRRITGRSVKTSFVITVSLPENPLLKTGS